MSNTDRFDRFNDQAQHVFSYAQEEAQRFKHSYIGTEHLLLGLIRDENNAASTILRSLGVELVKIRNAVEFIIDGGDVNANQSSQLGLTPRSRKAIKLAIDEARRFGHHYLGTEHLLLGLLREGEGIGAGVLSSLGVTLDRTRMRLAQVLTVSQQFTQPMPDRTSSEPVQPQSASTAPQEPLIIKPHAHAVLQTRSTRPYMGYPFTEQSHEVMEVAQQEAQRFKHSYIGTEHLLLGLVRESESVAGAALQNLGVELRRVRRAVEFIIGHGDRVILGEIGITPRAKHILELASEEAQRMDNAYVGTEHLLLGMMLEGEGIAAGVLDSFGIRLASVRSETARVLQYAQRENP